MLARTKNVLQAAAAARGRVGKRRRAGSDSGRTLDRVAFRDDREALLARAEALRAENVRLQKQTEKLEQENESLRADKRAHAEEKPKADHERRNAAKREEHEHRKAAKRVAADDRRALGPRTTRWSSLALQLLAILIGVAAAGLVVVLLVRSVGGARKRETRVVRLLLLDDGNTAVIQRSHRLGREETNDLMTVDLATGSTRTLDLSANEYLLYPRAGTRAWGLADGEPELLDLAAPAKLLERADLERAIPGLAFGYKLAAPGRYTQEYDAPLLAMPVVLHDGSKRFIDMTPALVETPPTNTPWRPGYFCDPDWGAKPSCERKECISFAPLPGTTALVRRTSEAPMTAEPTHLLRPGMVRLVETGCAFELDRAVLVIHDSGATEHKEELLSLVGADGRAQWTRRISDLTKGRKAEAIAARAVDRTIVVFLSDKQTLDIVRLTEAGVTLGHTRAF